MTQLAATETQELESVDGAFGDLELYLLISQPAGFVARRLGPEPLRLGRGGENDIDLADKSVSREHAILHTRPMLAVEDLGSANGTRVRGSRVEPGRLVPVVVGELIEVGAVTCLVQRARTSASASQGAGDPMARLESLVAQIAPRSLSVLLLGETGVGKEVWATRLHQRSTRAAAPFLKLNCAALSESLLESELFGHERGAFTGAHAAKPGLLEAADGGTLFLDEIGDLPPALQAKLLRALEEREVMRVGAVSARRIDVRFLAATNRPLEDDVAAGRFRRDLYFRLAGAVLEIPPLRERLGELPALATHFLERATDSGTAPLLSPDALAALRAHPWPGNIRELKNVLERAAALCGPGPIEPAHLDLSRATRTLAAAPATAEPASAPPAPPSAARPLRDDIAELERQQILDALQRSGGNQTRAAKLLGISRGTLRTRLDLYDLPRPRKRASDGD